MTITKMMTSGMIQTMKKKRRLIRMTMIVGTLKSQRRKPKLKEMTSMISKRLLLKQVELKLKVMK